MTRASSCFNHAQGGHADSGGDARSHSAAVGEAGAWLLLVRMLASDAQSAESTAELTLQWHWVAHSICGLREGVSPSAVQTAGVRSATATACGDARPGAGGAG